MMKIGRPVIYTVVGAIAVYAVVLLTEPEAPPRKSTTRVVRRTADAGGILREDLDARFARYAGSPRDAFRPLVAPKRNARGGDGGAAQAASGAPSGMPQWSLTGISDVNGQRMALIENAAGDDHKFLTTGDVWNGLTVAAIQEDAVIFVNALGQRSRITFVEPPEPTAARTAAPGAPGFTGAIPSLPALPGSGMPGAGSPGAAPGAVPGAITPGGAPATAPGATPAAGTPGVAPAGPPPGGTTAVPDNGTRSEDGRGRRSRGRF